MAVPKGSQIPGHVKSYDSLWSYDTTKEISLLQYQANIILLEFHKKTVRGILGISLESDFINWAYIT